MGKVNIDEVEEAQYNRACEIHDTMALYGDNFGEDASQLSAWVTCAQLISDESLSQDSPMSFWVFRGNNSQTSDVLNRGFIGKSSKFEFEHKHDSLRLRGPRGYGPSCKLNLKVAEQIASIDFSFKSPLATGLGSESNDYDSQGQSIEIIGTNFGGVKSPASVEINGQECLNAEWKRQHPRLGLPYISCEAQRTITGISNVSVFVAGQQGEYLMSLKKNL